jgi:hypothetical protein
MLLEGGASAVYTKLNGMGEMYERRVSDRHGHESVDFIVPPEWRERRAAGLVESPPEHAGGAWARRVGVVPGAPPRVCEVPRRRNS